MSSRDLVWSGVLALVVGLFAGPAFADDGACREECSEARVVCEAAATAAHRVCHARCADALEDAVRRARRICVERDLGPEACERLVYVFASVAEQGCRRDCRAALERARQRCAEEVRECRLACLPPLDPACVGACREEAAACRAELGACLGGCRETLAADAKACRELVADTCDLDGFKTCVREARAAAERCGHACYEGHRCGAELGMCLRECVDAVGD